MQPKVSIVVPCYNKVNYIRATFDSFLAQQWDNIELVIINDGSTDGTRDVIAEYEPIFLTRGFEVVIIDQENKGVACAVYEGLKRMTGVFVCQVDADDQIAPEYISAMAGWLAVHEDYEWALCDRIRMNQDRNQLIKGINSGHVSDCTVENYILEKMSKSFCQYMVRCSYLRKCEVINRFNPGYRSSQEPQIMIPLIWGKGMLKYIQSPLYIQNYVNINDHLTNHVDNNEYINARKEYVAIFREAINNLSASEVDKSRLLGIANFYELRVLLLYTYKIPEMSDTFNNLLEQYISLINRHFTPCPAIDANSFNKREIGKLRLAIENNILRLTHNYTKLNKKSSRIIAWGVLGYRGKQLLPLMQGTDLTPTELWDAAGDGESIKLPAPQTLTQNDLVLIIPHKNEDMLNEVKISGASVMSYDEVLSFLGTGQFAGFYNGTYRFEGENTARF